MLRLTWRRKDGSREKREPRINTSAAAGLVSLIVGAAAAALLFIYAAKEQDMVAEQIRIVGAVTVGAVFTIAAYNVLNDVLISRIPERVKKQVDSITGSVDALNKATDDMKKSLADMQNIQVFQLEEQALEQARAIQNDADCYVQAMWTLFPYDEELKTYFCETLAANVASKPKVRSERIVDVGRIPKEDVLDHIRSVWEYLADESYQLFLTRGSNYEVIIVDHGNAGLFLLPKGHGCCFIQAGESRTATVFRGMYEEHRRTERRVPVVGGVKFSEENLEKVERFVEDFCNE